MVRHFGMFEFKKGVTQTQINHCFTALTSMIGKIPGLLDIEHGPYESAEGLNENFTHGFIMTFESAKARDEYLPHPVHEAVKDIVVPNLQRVVVFDFEVKNK